MKNANSVFTRTNRIVIRQFELQDIEAFYQYRATPSIATYQSWENYTYEQAESFVQQQMTQTPDQPGTWFQYAIALSKSNQLVGDCVIHTLDSEPRIVEIGFTLAPEFQGKGYIHEALSSLIEYIFTTLNKHKIIAFTDVRNEKSIRVLERLDMRRE